MMIKTIVKYLVAIIFVLGGVLMLGWILGDNETCTPAGMTFLYLVIEGIFFYHYFRNRNIGTL